MVSLRELQTRKGRVVIEKISEVKTLKIWKEFVQHFKNTDTADAYLAEIAEFEKLCQKSFFQAGEKEAEQYYKWLNARAAQGEISGNTFAKKFWELHSFAAFAAERQGMYGVPSGFEDCFFSWLRCVRCQDKFVKSVPVEDIDALYIAASEDMQAYTIIALLHRAGLSSRELAQLKPGDIIVYTEDMFVYAESRDEPCFIPPDAARILKRFLQEREDNEYLFYNRNGNPLNKMYISRLLKKYTALAGIPSYSAEKIRTTCGVTMFAYGADSVQIAKQMGITGTQIQKYQNRSYRDNLLLEANKLVKIAVEAPY